MMRSAYESDMQLWADDLVLTRGRWIRVSDSTPFFDKPHLFGSAHTWDRNLLPAPDGPGEVNYVKWTNGGNVYGYQGSHICGSKLALETGGVHGRDDPIDTENDGSNDCCIDSIQTACPGKYPRNMFAWFLSDQNFCACGDGTMVPLRWIGRTFDPVYGASTPTWSSFPEDEYFRWGEGDCAGASHVSPTFIRIRLLRPDIGDLAHCQWIARISWYEEVSEGVFSFVTDTTAGLAQLALSPVHLVAALQWPAFAGECGNRFGVSGGASMILDVVGPAVPQ